jgi:hypothetical protein
MADRRIERDPVDYIDCEVPQDMTLREWRGDKPAGPERAKRIRAAAAAVGRRTRPRRRVS